MVRGGDGEAQGGRKKKITTEETRRLEEDDLSSTHSSQPENQKTGVNAKALAKSKRPKKRRVYYADTEKPKMGVFPQFLQALTGRTTVTSAMSSLFTPKNTTALDTPPQTPQLDEGLHHKSKGKTSGKALLRDETGGGDSDSDIRPTKPENPTISTNPSTPVKPTTPMKPQTTPTVDLEMASIQHQASSSIHPPPPPPPSHLLHTLTGYTSAELAWHKTKRKVFHSHKRKKVPPHLAGPNTHSHDCIGCFLCEKAVADNWRRSLFVLMTVALIATFVVSLIVSTRAKHHANHSTTPTLCSFNHQTSFISTNTTPTQTTLFISFPTNGYNDNGLLGQSNVTFFVQTKEGVGCAILNADSTLSVESVSVRVKTQDSIFSVGVSDLQRNANDLLSIMFDSIIPYQSNFTVSISYKLPGVSATLGLRKSSSASNTSTIFVHSKPLLAQSVLPIVNDPSKKFPIQLFVEVNSSDMVLGPSISTCNSERSATQSNRCVYLIGTTNPISPFMLGFVVGNFACRSSAVGTTVVSICSHPSTIDATAVALNIATKSVANMSTLVNTAFPFRAQVGSGPSRLMSLVCVEDLSVPVLCVPGFCLVQSALVLTLEEEMDETMFGDITRVIASAVVRQWVEGYSTFASWRDIWLAEGFSEYLVDLLVSILKTPVPPWQMSRTERGLVTTTQNPLLSAFPVAGETPPQQLFSPSLWGHPVTSTKAAGVLAMMHAHTAAVCSSSMCLPAAIGGFLRATAFSVSTTAFALESIAQHLGNDGALFPGLQFLYSSWVFRSRLPLVEVKLDEDASGQAFVHFSQVPYAHPAVEDARPPNHLDDTAVIGWFVSPSIQSVSPAYELKISQLNISLYSHVGFAYAIASESCNCVSPAATADIGRFRELTNRIKAHNNATGGYVKSLLGVRGLTNSSLARISATSWSRRQFAASVLSTCALFGFDGVHIHWEMDDARALETPQVAAMLRELNVVAKENGTDSFLVTLGAAAAPRFLGSVYHAAEIAPWVQWVSLMTHQVHEEAEGVTLVYNPLKGPEVSIEASMIAWVRSGFPVNKLVFSVGTFGQTFKLSTDNMGIGALVSGPGNAGPYTNTPGMLAYFEILEFLSSVGATQEYDPEANIMYATNGELWVGYDSPTTVRAKVRWGMENGLGGVALWSINTDNFLVGGGAIATSIRVEVDSRATVATQSKARHLWQIPLWYSVGNLQSSNNTPSDFMVFNSRSTSVELVGANPDAVWVATNQNNNAVGLFRTLYHSPLDTRLRQAFRLLDGAARERVVNDAFSLAFDGVASLSNALELARCCAANDSSPRVIAATATHLARLSKFLNGTNNTVAQQIQLFASQVLAPGAFAHVSNNLTVLCSTCLPKKPPQIWLAAIHSAALISHAPLLALASLRFNNFTNAVGQPTNPAVPSTTIQNILPVNWRRTVFAAAVAHQGDTAFSWLKQRFMAATTNSLLMSDAPRCLWALTFAPTLPLALELLDLLLVVRSSLGCRCLLDNSTNSFCSKNGAQWKCFTEPGCGLDLGNGQWEDSCDNPVGRHEVQKTQKLDIAERLAQNSQFGLQAVVQFARSRWQEWIAATNDGHLLALTLSQASAQTDVDLLEELVAENQDRVSASMLRDAVTMAAARRVWAEKIVDDVIVVG